MTKIPQNTDDRPPDRVKPGLEIRHRRAPGRLRVAVPAWRRSRHLGPAAQDALRGIPGVTAVSIGQRTGSVLLHFTRPHTHAEIAEAVANVLGIVLEQASRAGAPPHGRPLPRDGTLGAGMTLEAKPWHAVPLSEIRIRLNTDLGGLTDQDAAVRMQIFGLNEDPKTPQRSHMAILFDQFKNLPTGLLGASATMSASTGGVLDAALTTLVVLINGLYGFVTEEGAKRRISTFTERKTYNVSVYRSGRMVAIPYTNVVPGDLLLLKPGTVVPADTRLLTADRLTTNEALLTGESEPREKQAEGVLAFETPLGDRANMVYGGAVVMGGTGTAVVVATGASSELGRMTMLAARTPTPLTPMEQELERLSERLALLAVGVGCLVFTLGVLHGHSKMLMLKSAVALAVAAIPEGLPTVATTTLALGLQRMRRIGISVRRLNAVEALGSVQVLCFDKTGTITQNKMAAVRIRVGDRDYGVQDETIRDCGHAGDAGILRELLEVAALCNDASTDEYAVDGSGTERGLLNMARDGGVDITQLRRTWPRTAAWHRDKDHRYMRTIHQSVLDGTIRIAVKGDPLQVLDMCCLRAGAEGPEPLTPSLREQIHTGNRQLAAGALRVLGFATAQIPAYGAPENAPLIWLGATGLADPIRPGAVKMIERLHQAGIRPVMITGDQSVTAQAVAAEIDLSFGAPIESLDSSSLTKVAPDVLTDLSKRAHIFARVPPSQKLEIVKALQRAGLTVGMTGDGINDAAALKAADVALAVGDDSASVARDIADIIVHTEDLEVIADAVVAGRTILANVRKAVHFLISTNLSEILVVMAETLRAGDEIESPRELFWLNLVTDILPGLALAQEPGDPDLYSAPATSGRRGFIDGTDVAHWVGESLPMAVASILSHSYGLRKYGASPSVRTMTFTTLVTSQLLHSLTCRRDRYHPFDRHLLLGNRTLSLAVAGSFALQALPLFWPRLRRLLGLGPVSTGDLILALGGGIASFATNQTILAARSRIEMGNWSKSRGTR